MLSPCKTEVDKERQRQIDEEGQRRKRVDYYDEIATLAEN